MAMNLSNLEYWNRLDELDEEFLPDNFNYLIKQSVTAEATTTALDLESWKRITRELTWTHTGMIKATRYVNGLVMLARNLVTIPGAFALAEKCHLDLRITEILSIAITSHLSRLSASCTQFLANCFGNSENNSLSHEKLISRALEVVHAANRQDLTAVWSLPLVEAIIRLHHVTIKMGSIYADALATLLLNKNKYLLQEFVDNADEISEPILQCLIEIVAFLMCKNVEWVLQLEYTCNRANLVKLVDAAIANNDDLTQSQHRTILMWFVKNIIEIKDDVVAIITKKKSVSKEEAFYLWNILLVSLRGIQTEMIAEEVMETNFLKHSVEILHSLESNIQKRSKLRDLDMNGENETWQRPEEFPEIKSEIIAILALLAENAKTRTQVQNFARESHALEVVLSNCIIDRNNPYIRERSILCIKHLLHDSRENQIIVSQLEARGTVREEDIVAAGYETELIDGKVALKKSEDKAASKIEEL